MLTVTSFIFAVDKNEKSQRIKIDGKREIKLIG